MDIGKAFGYLFDDPQWLNKLLVGSLIILISLLLSPILVGLVGFVIVSGYTLEVLRNVRHGNPQPLPEWKDRWGEWLVLGIKLFVVALIWALPGILLNIPTSFGNFLVESGNDLFALGGWMVVAFTSCLSLLWWIVVALVSPALYIRVAETEEITSGLQFREIFEFTRDHIGEVILAVVLVLVSVVVLITLSSTVGLLLCLVGILVLLPAAIFYGSLIEAHLFAQIGLSGGRSPVPASAPAAGTPPVAAEPSTVAPEPDEMSGEEGPNS